MAIIIYGLQDPATKKIHYVGASKDPQSRLRNHICNARGSQQMNADLTIWILRLLLSSKEPEIVFLEEASDKGWEYSERRWINKLRQEKHPICNKHKGGECGGSKTGSAVKIRLQYRHLETLDRISEDLGDNRSQLIAEAIDNYWGKYDAGRTDSLARAIEDDARGDGYLLGTEASVAGKPSGDGPDKD